MFKHVTIENKMFNDNTQWLHLNEHMYIIYWHLMEKKILDKIHIYKIYT